MVIITKRILYRFILQCQEKIKKTPKETPLELSVSKAPSPILVNDNRYLSFTLANHRYRSSQNKSWNFRNLCCPIVLGSGSGKRF